MTSSLWHLRLSNPTTQATTSRHYLPKHRIRDVHAHLPRSRRSSSLGSQPNLVPQLLSCHAAATLVLVRPSPYLRSLWLEHELRHRTAPLHHYARSSIARYVTPDYVQYGAFLCRRVNARVAFQSTLTGLASVPPHCDAHHLANAVAPPIVMSTKRLPPCMHP